MRISWKTWVGLVFLAGWVATIAFAVYGRSESARQDQNTRFSILSQQLEQARVAALSATTEVTSLRQELVQVRVQVAELRWATATNREFVKRELEQLSKNMENVADKVELQRLADVTTQLTKAEAQSEFKIKSLTLAKLRAAKVFMENRQSDSARALAISGLAELIGSRGLPCGRASEVGVPAYYVPEEIREFLRDGGPYVLLGTYRDGDLEMLRLWVQPYITGGC